MNDVLRRLNIWTLNLLTANNGWLAIPRSKRRSWAALLIGEMAAAGALAGYVAGGGGAAAWSLAVVTFLAFAAFVWALAENPVRAVRAAPQVGMSVTVALLVIAAGAAVIRVAG